MSKNYQTGDADSTILPFESVKDENAVDPKLLALLDQVCESGEASLTELDAYLDATRPEDGKECPFDTEAELARFHEKHGGLFTVPVNEPPKPSAASRAHRWGYRLMVVAAAIVVLSALCTVALGRNVFDVIAQWGDETFRLHKSDFETSEDGNIIYYPDGSRQDRSHMDNVYDHDTYEPIPEENEKRMVTAANAGAPVPDPNAPLGSPENPIPVDEDAEPFGHFEEADVAALGLERGESVWDESRSIERFRILNKGLTETVEAYDIRIKLFPTWIPDGFSQDYIEVIQDHLTNATDFFANYKNGSKEYAIDSRTLEGGFTNGIYEKDDRPVIEYTAGGVDYYILHNLSRVVAVAMVGNREISIGGDVTVDEVKKMIDSIYEGE